MSILKQVIHYPDTNSVEATWVDRVESYRDIDGEVNIDGSVAQQLVLTDTQVKCHSYSDRQMDMLRADLGADAADYADLIAEVEANQIPYPEPTPEQIASEAKATLREIDIASIRALREYVAAQPDAPQIIKDKEAAAAVERGKLR